MADTPSLPLPADRALTCSAGGRAAAGSDAPADPAARLIATAQGVSALGGNLRLIPLLQDGARMLRVELHGVAVDAALDDDALDHLRWLLARPSAGGAR